MKAHVVDSLDEFWGEPIDHYCLQWLTSRTHFQSADFKQPSVFDSVRQKLEGLESSGAARTRLFYLAVAPSFTAPIPS